MHGHGRNASGDRFIGHPGTDTQSLLSVGNTVDSVAQILFELVIIGVLDNGNRLSQSENG